MKLISCQVNTSMMLYAEEKYYKIYRTFRSLLVQSLRVNSDVVGNQGELSWGSKKPEKRKRGHQTSYRTRSA